jgi:hypothetical protein
LLYSPGFGDHTSGSIGASGPGGGSIGGPSSPQAANPRSKIEIARVDITPMLRQLDAEGV